MAGILQHLRSSTLDKRPNPGSMVDGQVAINYASGSPGLFFKDSAGALVKVGPVHVGSTAPNVSPASGGTAGNTRGEQWLDTSGGSYVMKIWDGSAWRTEAGEFVNTTGDIMTGALGMPPASSGSPTIYFSGDTDTGLYSPGANQLAISTGGTGRLFVASTGSVGIGTSAPGAVLHTYGAGGNNAAILIESSTAADGQIRFKNTSGYISAGLTGAGGNSYLIYDGLNSRTAYNYNGLAGGDSHVWFTNNSERARIDSSGRLLVGTSSAFTSTNPASLQVAGGGIGIGTYAGATAGTYTFEFLKSRSSTVGGTAIVAASDNLGQISFNGTDGTQAVLAATIKAEVDGTPGANDMPGRLVFSTTADGAGSPTERMVIKADGKVGIGTSSPLTKLDVRSGVITAGSDSSPSGSEILRGYYSNTDGALAVIGTEYSSGGIVIGFAVKPSTSTSDAFLSSTPLIAARGAYTIAGNTHKWYLGGAQTVAENSSVSTSEVMRIDSSGRLLLGPSIARTSAGSTPQFQIEGGNANSASFSVIIDDNTPTPSRFYLGKSRGTVFGSTTIVQANDSLGEIYFTGTDGSSLVGAGAISCQVDGTPGANDMPGRLVFSTTADGASSPTERMRISQNGQVLVAHGTTSSVIQAESSIASGYANGIFVARFTGYSPNTTSNYFFYGEDTTGARAYIRSNGGLVNYQANDVNLSDRNAKKDITPAAGTWDCIKDWEIVNYRYKDQPDDADLNLGVIAQQVAKSCPEVITVFEEAKDDQPEKLGVKEQQMYWMAIKALQEAMERIETLEAKVAALESA